MPHQKSRHGNEQAGRYIIYLHSLIFGTPVFQEIPIHCHQAELEIEQNDFGHRLAVLESASLP